MPAREGKATIRLMAAASWLAFPVYVWQGIGTRLRTPRLLPPSDSPFGRIEGAAPEIRLLVIGESSAAAVGLDSMEDGVAAAVARSLHRRTGRAVSYRSAGFNGATAAQLRDHAAPQIEPRDWTHVLVTVGVNDTKNFNTGSHWKKGFGGLLYALKARFPHARIYWSQILLMTEVPALSPALARILQVRARLMNLIATGLCGERGATAIPHMTGLTPEAFCIDGFHPSVSGMEGWAEHMVAFMEFDIDA